MTNPLLEAVRYPTHRVVAPPLANREGGATLDMRLYDFLSIPWRLTSLGDIPFLGRVGDHWIGLLYPMTLRGAQKGTQGFLGLLFVLLIPLPALSPLDESVGERCRSP